MKHLLETKLADAYVQEKFTQIGKKNNIYCMVVIQLVLLPDFDKLVLPGKPPY